MSIEEPLRFDSRKRLQAVKGLPVRLIKKFVIIENRDSRGRVTFHLAFKMTKMSRPDTQVIPKQYRTFSSLIEAELAIFEIVKIHLCQREKTQFPFIDEKTQFKKIILFLKEFTRIILNK